MSIVDIAKEAGVSVTTVSRYFNNPEKIATDTAEKIKKAVADNNFQVNIRRPGPKTSERVGIKTGVVVFLSLDIVSPQQMLNMQALPLLINSIQQALAERGLFMLMMHVNADGTLPTELNEKNCDGIILYGKLANDKHFAKIRKTLLKFPAVWCFREHSDNAREFDHILYDNNAVGPTAAEYLAQNGHKNVVVFNAQIDHRAYSMRVKTFLDAAKHFNLNVSVIQPDKHFEELSLDVYKKMADDFLKNNSNCTGGLFCSDGMLLGIINELRIKGFPTEKFDAIGVNNNTELLRFVQPYPATIDIKMADIGYMAVEQLVNRMNQKCGSYCSEIFIRPELIKGNF